MARASGEAAAQGAPAKAPTRVSPLEHTLIGAMGGTMEVFIMQPTVAIKNALQEGRPLPRAPRELYRGLLINACSMAPITATQFGTNRIVERALLSRKQPGAPLGSLEKFAGAAVSGAVSALVASPTELIIIQQQKKGTALREEVRSFFKAHSPISIYRGIAPCIMRESLYAAGYLGLCPILYDKLKHSSALEGYPSGMPMLLAGIAGGVFGAAASHPFDTVKTRMQAFMYTRPEYLTWLSTVRTIVAEGGVLNLWSGLLPRMFRIIGATFILVNFRGAAVGYLDGVRTPQPAQA